MVQLVSCWRCLLLLCLLLGIGVVCLQECFVDDLLVFRPRDPFAFQNEPFHACCEFVERKNFTVSNISLNNVTFSCNGDASDELNTTAVSQVDGQYDGNSEFSPHAACSDLTVQSGPWTTCRCQVLGWPRCNAHQAVTVDVPLPNELIFDCIVYGKQNLTCKPDVPEFFHPGRVKTHISWSQIGGLFGQQKSKICAQYDSCVVTRSDDHMIFDLLFMVNFNVSMKLEYFSASGFQGSGKQDSVVKIAGWRDVDFKKIMMLKMVTPIVDEVNATSLSLNGVVDDVFSKKTVHINYTSLEPWSNSHGHQEIHLDINPTELSTTLVDLSPFTKYSVCVSVKPVKSDLWSHPGCVEVTTQPDVPARSPKTMEDAFCIQDSSTVLVYWKPLQEWEWNSPRQEGRKYVGQEIVNADWTNGPAVNWTHVETTVEVWGPHGHGMDFQILAVNNLGRAAIESRVIRIPKEKDIIPGPTDIKAVFKSSKKMVNITWQSDDVDVQSSAFWCQQGLQQHTCLNSFDWKRPVRKGENSVSIPVNSVQEARQSMYGVALSKTKGTGQPQSSGIHWQTCILVMDGNSTNKQGDCDPKIEKISSSDQGLPVWVIPFGILLVIVIVVIIYVKRRMRKKKDEFKLMHLARTEPTEPNGDVGHGDDYAGYEQVPIAGSSAGSHVELLPYPNGYRNGSVVMRASNGGQSEPIGQEVDGGVSNPICQEVGGRGNEVVGQEVSVHSGLDVEDNTILTSQNVNENSMDEGMFSSGNASSGGNVSNENAASVEDADGNSDSGDDNSDSSDNNGGDADGSGGIDNGNDYAHRNVVNGLTVIVNTFWDNDDEDKEYMRMGQESM